MRKLVLILLITWFSACESMVDLEIPDGYQSKLIIESYFSSDSIWSMRVGKSVHLLDTSDFSDLIVPNAQVIISGRNNFSDTLEYDGSGFYRSVHNHYPQSGINYTAEVIAPGFPGTISSSQAPLLRSELLEIRYISRDDSLQTDEYAIRFKVEDQSGPNYYTLALYQVAPVCYLENWGSIIRDDPKYSIRLWGLRFRSSYPDFHSYIETVDDPTIPELGFYDYGFPYFSDQLFEARTQEFQLRFDARYLNTIGPHFMIQLQALSVDLFAYERSIVIQDLFISEPNFSDKNPNLLYSNVQNGLGVFAGYTTKRHQVSADGGTWNEAALGVVRGELQDCEE